jgi:hypothetical protein
VAPDSEQEATMGVTRTLGEMAAAAGAGALAGLAGTAAMTLSSSVEATVRGREPSDAPARAAGALLRVRPRDEQGKKRFSTAVHWGYGTGWGAARGLIGVAGLRGPAAAAAHLGAVWGGEQIVLPATGVSGPAWTWEAKEVAVDLFHHAVYAVATSATYELLDPRRRAARRSG